jgi:hypothetical protein
MTNWNKPDSASSKTAFPAEIKEMTRDAVTLTHNSPSNLPSGAIRYNRTTRNFEEWNGSSYVILPIGFEVGDVKGSFSNTAPTGFLPLQGGTIGNAASAGTARANADTELLFTYLWNNLADAQAPVSSGRGASAAADFAANKRITLPDSRQRFPIGKAASGTGSTLGGTGGNIDHTHSVPAHHHGMGTGADLNITSSGSGTSGTESADHTHTFSATSSGFSANHQHSGKGARAFVMTGTGGDAISSFSLDSGAAYTLCADTTTDNTGSNHTHTVSGTTSGKSATHTHSTPSHTHPSGNVAGRVGLVTGGVDGNAAMTSGTGNPAFLALNFFIKY